MIEGYDILIGDYRILIGRKNSRSVLTKFLPAGRDPVGSACRLCEGARDEGEGELFDRLAISVGSVAQRALSGRHGESVHGGPAQHPEHEHPQPRWTQQYIEALQASGRSNVQPGPNIASETAYFCTVNPLVPGYWLTIFSAGNRATYGPADQSLGARPTAGIIFYARMASTTPSPYPLPIAVPAPVKVSHSTLALVAFRAGG